MQYDKTLTTAQLNRMLESIQPAWKLENAVAVDAGHHPVYRLQVGTPDGRRTVYLKATPPEKQPTVDLEGRILAGIDAQSDVPVPSIHGIVDEHDDLPAPYVLLSAAPGETHSRQDLNEIDDQRLQQIGYWCGTHLAMLHEIDAVDSYGYLTYEGPPLRGESPPGDFSGITVHEGGDEWRECLHAWGEQTLQQLEETRFADVPPRVESVLSSEIERLEGSFDPVIARIDSSIENLLIESDGIGAFIDWEFTIATPRAYDLSCVAWSLAGGPYRFSPETTDRHPLVREAVLAGYENGYDGEIREQFNANRSCYELLSTLRSMIHLEGWYELFNLESSIDGASKQLREELDRQLHG